MINTIGEIGKNIIELIRNGNTAKAEHELLEKVIPIEKERYELEKRVRELEKENDDLKAKINIIQQDKADLHIVNGKQYMEDNNGNKYCPRCKKLLGYALHTYFCEPCGFYAK